MPKKLTEEQKKAEFEEYKKGEECNRVSRQKNAANQGQVQHILITGIIH